MTHPQRSNNLFLKQQTIRKKFRSLKLEIEHPEEFHSPDDLRALGIYYARLKASRNFRILVRKYPNIAIELQSELRPYEVTA